MVQGIVAIIALLIIAGGAYYFGTKNSPFDCCDGEQYDNPPISESTSDLKTYTDEKYGFSFDYPLSWSSIEELPVSNNDYLPNSRSFIAIYSTGNRKDFSARIDIYDASIETVMKDNKSLTLKDLYDPEPVYANGIYWTSINDTDILVEKNRKTYHISSQQDDLRHQILSTFKFTSPTPPVVKPPINQNNNIKINPNELTDAYTNVYYRQKLNVEGFSTSTIRWEIISGSLPSGFYLQKVYITCPASSPLNSPSNCGIPDSIMFEAVIGGITTKEGTYNFTVKASNDTKSVTKSYTLKVKPGFTVKINKSSYSENDPIEMTFTAYNQTNTAKVFSFQSSCQTTYRINNSTGSNFFDSQNTASCQPTPTSVTVPAYGDFTWSITHSPEKYKLQPGVYKILGGIIGQAHFDSDLFTITPATPSAVTVLSPNGGERWVSNSIHAITWSTTLDKNLKVNLHLDVGSPCTNIPSDISVQCPPSLLLDENIPISTVYNWIVGTDIDNNRIPPGEYFLRVCLADNTKCDQSNNRFTITPPTPATSP